MEDFNIYILIVSLVVPILIVLEQELRLRTKKRLSREHSAKLLQLVERKGK